jgi:NAD(P)-dependent dehydrogenase (short-subunit alcohol dehydrogenase family)
MTISKDLFSLAGKVAIVTGAGGRSGGIGEAYASALGVFGASVVVADINAEGAEGAAERLRSRGVEAIGAAVDISDPASVADMVARAKAAFGGVDILVNNAALMVETLTFRTTTVPLEDWNRILSVNLTGALLCAQAVIPSMLGRGWGRIVNQLSSGAFPAQGVYGISKLALMGLTTALASELGRSNITVNAIAPGITDSGAGLSLRTDPPNPYFKMLKDTCPLPIPGLPDQLTGALLYLCSAAGDWTTGQVLHVDGGAVLRP